MLLTVKRDKCRMMKLQRQTKREEPRRPWWPPAMPEEPSHTHRAVGGWELTRGPALPPALGLAGTLTPGYRLALSLVLCRYVDC